MRPFSIRQTNIFSDWEAGLTDIRVRAAVASRIDRLGYGLAGDVVAVGDGISELRIHLGPGYRIYFCRRGREIMLLLCGGDKRSQRQDIRMAKILSEHVDDGHARNDQ